MRQAGYVLTGGASSRMGKDKALLPFRGRTLVEWVAQQVKTAAGSVTLVGSAARYGFLGLPVIEDQHAGCGPLSGIEAALAHSGAEWNLVVACDMPNLTAPFLSWILKEAVAGQEDIVMPVGAGGREPLCAVYRRTCLPAAQDALVREQYKVSEAFRSMRIKLLLVSEQTALVNANTPLDWEAALRHAEARHD
ncbi:MAG: molybdenum cofactor guanylyltransferase [Bryobacterales bacterium]|nr:molybdenum cofactor guanylyltransferase [Bryobacterales bacterium]